MLDEAVHGPIGAVHVLVDQPWDEVRSESNHKCLDQKKREETTLDPPERSYRWVDSGILSLYLH